MVLSKFLDPKLDLCFKRIFGTEKNKDILIDFLNDMLYFRSTSKIKDVTFLKTSQDPEIAYKKQSIVDILCMDQNNNKLIVEMQVAHSPGFEKRAQYYAAKAYIGQMDKGDSYFHNLKEVIFLAITDFVMFKQKLNYKSDHVILDLDSYEQDLKDFSFTFLELPKFTKTIDELSTPIERWSYFLKHADETAEQDIAQITQDMPSLKRAYEELNQYSWSKQELFDYEQELKHERDNRIIEEAKINQAVSAAATKALAEGLAKGIEQGKADGIEQGKEQGKVEEKIAIAQNLLNLGMDAQEISKVTMLSLIEIEKLKK